MSEFLIVKLSGLGKTVVALNSAHIVRITGNDKCSRIFMVDGYEVDVNLTVDRLLSQTPYEKFNIGNP